jgi:hypothetical protein
VAKFQGAGELSSFLVHRAASAVHELKAIPDQAFLADVDGCVEEIYERYALDELTVSGVDGVHSEGSRATKVAEHDTWDRRSFQVDGTEITIRIPFTGSRELWSYQPSTRYVTAAYLHIRQIANDHFVFVMGARELDPNQVRGALEQSINQLSETAGWINTDVRNWLPRLRADLEATARDRQGRLGRVSALDAALGIPILATSADKAIPIPVKRTPLKRPAPAAPAPVTRQRVLQDDVYQDVLRTIEQMGRAMERTPTAAKLKEEELRNLILIVLNANYEGAVRGEVFNGKGKTDLLLNWEGDNAFIGECKNWTGPAKFREAIDQLLGYVTWRDTKAALILFIKKGAPTDVIAKARAEIGSHASHVRLKAAVSETRFDYILQSPDDPERHIDCALIAVVIQQPAQPD